ncbi:MAG: hypothetical protein BECKG1743E_GA0114224_110931, partial [Candidatus Kentron sp. G]
QPLPWVCRTRGTTLKGLRRYSEETFLYATGLGLISGHLLPRVAADAATLGYDTQPLRGKEGNSSR